MKLTKPERKRLIQALCMAVDESYGLIDAHCICYQRGKDAYLKDKVPSPEDRVVVARWKRDIEAFKKLIRKLKEDDA